MDRPPPPDWVIEGFRQIRLAVALERCAVEADTIAKKTADLIRSRILSYVLVAEWLPDTKAAALELARRKNLGSSFWEEAAATFANTLPENASSAQAAKILHRACTSGSSTTPSIGVRSWPRWIEPAAVWVQLGHALSNWADLVPQLRGAMDEIETIYGLAAAFDRSADDPGVPPGLKPLYKAAGVAFAREVDGKGASSSGLAAGIRQVREVLAMAPPEWPPFILRDGLRGIADWEQLKSNCRPASEPLRPGLAPEAAGRVQLAIGYIDFVDRLAESGKIPGGSWELLDSTIQRLLKPCGLTGEIQREFGSSSTERVEAPSVSAPRFERTGLRIVQPDSEVTYERTARVLVPPPRSRLKAAVQHMVGTDASLAELANELVYPAADAWKSLTPDERVAWWRLVFQSVNQSTPASLSFLHRLGELDFKLVATPHVETVSGPWFVVPSANREPQAGPKFALRFPDGIEFGPAIAVQLGPPTRPLVRCLVGCEPSLVKLRQHDPEWPGWSAYNDAVWALAYRNGDSSERDSESALAAFDAVYQRSFQDDSYAGYYREIAGRLYRCLHDELRVAVVPALDPTTLTPIPIQTLPTDGTEIEWSVGASIPGTVLQVLRFRSAERPARLRVGLGANGAALCEWLNLPVPPPGPLTAWWQSARSFFADANKLAKVAGHHQQAISTWLETPAGLEWFAQSGPDDPWVRQLIESHWCPRCPPIDSQTERPYWPAEYPHDSERVRWEFSESVSFRGLIRDARMAPVASQAGGVFSLGSRSSAKRYLVAADELRALVPQVPLLDRVWSTAVASVFRTLEGRAVSKLATDLAAWVGTAPPAAVTFVRDWCAGFGYDLLTNEDGSVPSTPRFHSEHPVGTVWMVQYGLKTTERAIALPVEAVSAGPAPRYFAELEAAVAALAESDLTERLANWAKAAMGEYLEGVVAEFYVQLWYHCERDSRPGKYAVAKDVLLRLIRENYGWTQFEPVRLGDFDEGWIEYDRSRPGRSGEIQQVLRPGLQDGENRKVAAKVIAD